MARTGNLKFTLRSHDCPVTVLEYFYSPNHYSQTNQLLSTTLISGDETGTLVWWNLNTRRPILKWKAHDNNILSVKQLGLQWRISEENHDCLIPVFGDYFGLLMTHSRDNTMKLWDLASYINNTTSVIPSGNGPTANVVELTPVLVEQINSLNFCNIDVLNDRFCSLNRLNPDFFDVTVVNYDSKTREYSTEMMFESIDPGILVKNISLKMSSSELKKLKKLGIIMKLKWISPTQLVLGFESGHLLTLYFPPNTKSLTYIDDRKIQQLEDMLNVDNLESTYQRIAEGNTDAIAHIIYGDTTSGSGIVVNEINSFHYPNPILDIAMDMKHCQLLVSSTGSKLMVSRISNIVSEVKEINDDYELSVDLKSIGISSVDTRIDDLVAVTFWNGQVKFYQQVVDTNNNRDLNKLPFKITKEKAHIAKEFSANPNDPEILANKQIRRFKSNVVRVAKVQSLKSLNELARDYKAANVKDLLSYKRFLKDMANHWVAVAYDDGSVELHEVGIAE
ncbi:hypothetical protein DASC09_053980 [Saccharomycopsis crataegensis]|uniref:ASTRA-associated protein 1 n=1 Tax=Saccharomycopsis crataegensis TaxID=43959 RepID=A0AAV5QT27_9ASCO|nr:hypothetical protein DASC09_053980 [Saccharomycopsis crataegensis]